MTGMRRILGEKMKPTQKLDLDLALEEVARKVRPVASVYTISPSNCATSNCSPQCECCSSEIETCWTYPRCQDSVYTTPGCDC